MEFRNRLTQIMQKRGVSAYRIRKDLKLGNSIIANWLTGDKFPDVKNLIKLADYFDVSIDYLVGRTNDPEPSIKSITSEELEELHTALSSSVFQDMFDKMTPEQRKEFARMLIEYSEADKEKLDQLAYKENVTTVE